MTTSAFPFLDGRTSLDAAPVRVPRRDPRRRGGFLEHLRRRFRRARLDSAQRERDRRYTTDGYLDRSGLSSVDWPNLLTDHAKR
jgi:hypothetical protein